MSPLPLQFYKTPRIIFGPGQLSKLGEMVQLYGSPALLICGKHSLSDLAVVKIRKQIWQRSIDLTELRISGEPSPDMIDTIVNEYKHTTFKVIIGIGGGSTIDAAKAVSAMIPINDSVKNYLECIGTNKHPGAKIPFIAIPTTAGTGSEASANAVLSQIGPDGFKRSIRHDNLVPDIAIIDPELTLSCPDEITAACGMDALTQLIESYVSTKASIFTDALIESALPRLKDSLSAVTGDGRHDIEARTDVAYASMISGIALANAGLGIIHGLASPLGGFFPIPHGTVCGTLLAAATKITINKLKRENPSSPALLKYAKAGQLLTGSNGDIDGGISLLIEKLYSLTEALNLPLLSNYGVKATDFDKIIKESGNKNNPADLDNDEIRCILQERI
jgi:alcohol dehydrogenase class IV